MAPASKQSIKAINQLNKLLLAKKKQVKTSELVKIGIKIPSKKFQVNNIELEKNIIADSYYLTVIDGLKDLNGNQIADNKKLQTKVLSNWHAGKNKISKKELLNFGIVSSDQDIDILNLKLSCLFGLTNFYEIQIIDPNKSGEGQWIESAVSMKRVVDALLEFPYSKAHLKLNEVSLNKEIETFLKTRFESVTRSTTTNKGLLDLTIGGGKKTIAVEMKLAKQLITSLKSDACIGQLERYMEQFGESLLFLVAGQSADMKNKFVEKCFKAADKKKIKAFRMMV